MKLIVAGTRTIAQAVVWSTLNAMTNLPDEIVCGMCSGPDLMAAAWAINKKIKVAEFPAHWSRHGNRAGPLRNLEMAQYADELLAFWDGKSKGTKHMIESMKKLGKPVTVIHVNS